MFIIGNGDSRKYFNLYRLGIYGKIYGCNALYRDFNPDLLVCMDTNMQKEVIQNGYGGLCVFANRPNAPKELYYWKLGLRTGTVDHDYGYDSGCTAVRLHCKEFDVHYLIGFDCDGKNELYSGTDNYTHGGNEGNETRRNLGIIFGMYNWHKFYLVGSRLKFTPTEWKDNNVEFIGFEKMFKLLEK